jgi:Ca-activated chloride channel family protein
MNQPQIKFIPLRQAVSAESPTVIDVICEITVPQAETSQKRPVLNIALVLDRSGSMSGAKIEYARQAACYGIAQLLPTDYVAVTIYDSVIETIVPSTLARDKSYLTYQIRTVQARNRTNLHGGWLEGGKQAKKHFDSSYLNRVILLSDGLANTGLTHPNEIALNVSKLAEEGISTTTMGVGNDYNEDLLQLMATRGDGNYYYIDTPDQLPEIFGNEMQGIMRTIGRNVTMRLDLPGDVELVDVFNDFELTPQAEYKLPNLTLANNFSVVMRLKVSPQSHAKELLQARLSWDNSEQEERQKVSASLILPAVADAQLADLPLDEEVQRQVILMLASRAKEEAVKQVDRGNYEAAHQILQETHKQVLAAPESELVVEEIQALSDLDEDLQERQISEFRKSSRYQSHLQARGGVSKEEYEGYQRKRSVRRVPNRKDHK